MTPLNPPFIRGEGAGAGTSAASTWPSPPGTFAVPGPRRGHTRNQRNRSMAKAVTAANWKKQARVSRAVAAAL